MRGLIGFETDLVNQTSGMGVMSHLFHEYGADRGEIAARKNGSLVSIEDGEATAYALDSVQERGRLMVVPGDKIYAGMIVGENARDQDLPVNPCKVKKLTNMRSQGDGKGIQLNARSSSASNAPSNTSARTNTWRPHPGTCACAKSSSTKTTARRPASPGCSSWWRSDPEGALLVSEWSDGGNAPSRGCSRQMPAVDGFQRVQHGVKAVLRFHHRPPASGQCTGG
jgi:hypothetical protein